jgi:hypothetical protein
VDFKIGFEDCLERVGLDLARFIIGCFLLFVELMVVAASLC